MIIKYPCNITKDQDRFLVTFPDFPEALTEGLNLEEALFNAIEALTLTLEARLDEKIDIPTPSLKKHQYWITPSVQVQSALLIRFARAEKTISDLARILETSWPAASKLENPHHWPTLRQLDKTAAALGKKLVISMEEIVR
ncbi:MAG: HicB family protein [Rickettsiales bacterium]|nr:MAG: HicB family protein [Rickettsiales bacterium]